MKINVKVGCVLCFNDAYSARFLKNILPPLSISTLKMGAVCFSKTLADYTFVRGGWAKY
jgi:hypothetical protein